MSESSCLCFLCNCPDEETALRLARLLVTEKLAACVNIMAGTHSIYRWQGVVEEASETTLIIKSTTKSAENLMKTLKEAHPYEVPEIIALPIVMGLPAYLDWIETSTE